MCGAGQIPRVGGDQRDALALFSKLGECVGVDVEIRLEGVHGVDSQHQIEEASQVTSLKRALPALRTGVGQRDHANPSIAESRERFTGSRSSRK
jgi:hypothetical protein